jgi:hypothetical protein
VRAKEREGGRGVGKGWAWGGLIRGGQEVGKGWAYSSFKVYCHIYLLSKCFPIINTVNEEEETSEILLLVLLCV